MSDKSGNLSHLIIDHQSFFLSLCLLGNFAFLSFTEFFFEINLQKFFQKYHLSVKQFGSRLGMSFCHA